MRILIGTNHLVDFGGSELVIFDIAKYLRDQHHNITVVTFSFDEPLKGLFLSEAIDVVELTSGCLSTNEYDLMWVQHAPICYELIYNMKVTAKKVIFSSLSPFEPLEAPPVFMNELPLLLVNSLENRDEVVWGGGDLERIFVFNNSVPDSYFSDKRVGRGTELKRIAVVSNHVPTELEEAAMMLRKASIEVDLFGYQNQVQYVTQEILERYDAVITIGRTVQHALALLIPVYCYDHFGGPGWILPSNIQEAEYYNFSGRCTRRKLSAQQIFSEIVEQFKEANLNCSSLYDYAKEKYRLSSNVQTVLSLIENAQPFNRDEIVRDFPMLGRHNRYYTRERDRLRSLQEWYSKVSNDLVEYVNANNELWGRVHNAETTLSKVSEEKHELLQKLSHNEAVFKNELETLRAALETVLEEQDQEFRHLYKSVRYYIKQRRAWNRR